MLQTIYEGEARLSTDSSWRELERHGKASTVEANPQATLLLETASPLDLRTDTRMLGLTGDSDAWERRLQQELLLIQKQQQLQKQLLISEFQKQHESLTRQHQAQLQEHLKLQQKLLAMKQEQQIQMERKMEQHSPEPGPEARQVPVAAKEPAQDQALECHRRDKHLHILRGKERPRESAVASTEVKQKLQDFLLNKPAKEPVSNGISHSLGPRPKLWYTSGQHMSMDQSSPPLAEGSPVYCPFPSTPDSKDNFSLRRTAEGSPLYNCPIPSTPDGKDNFPLRKTASEPNLKVRSRLKQKVAERRSSPLMRRKDGSVVVAPYKKRVLEFTDSLASSSAPGSGPSSPNGACSALGAENGPSALPTTAQTERLLSHQRLFNPEDSMTLLSLYTSPSLPNITLGLPSAPSPIHAATALKERHIEGSSGGSGRQVLTGHFLGAMPPVALETKVNSSHQVLLQHLLLKEQMRQQKILTSGMGTMLPQSPLAMRDRPSGSLRHKLPRHRPLNRTQSAPLPQSTLAQLVIQQQHQNFVEKQKQYHQQIHLNQMLSQSIEHLRQPSTHLQEEEEEEHREERMRDTLLSGGVIRKHSQSSCSSEFHIRVKEEPTDSEDEAEYGKARQTPPNS